MQVSRRYVLPYLLRSGSSKISSKLSRSFATSTYSNKESYQIVVVGGGSGGCSSAAKFSAKLGKGKVAVVEPSQVHYYQPMWTLVGGGMKTLSQSVRPMEKVLPKNAKWYQNSVASFLPKQNTIVLNDGTEIGYEFLVVALGLQLNYSQIKGLPEAFETPGVCSNFSAAYVEKTYEALKNFRSGNVIFTHPNSPIKCPGASQKILYIAEEFLKNNSKKSAAQIQFNTALPVLFGVKKYAEALWKVVEERGIKVNLKHNLIEVIPERREAVFSIIGSNNETVTMPYEILHITPPMSAPDILKRSEDMADNTGFLSLNKDTLQHTVFPNIFGIGDCTNLPTSKTAAAVAAQLSILKNNLLKAMEGKNLDQSYDGYTSCPLVTGYSKCILAEFDYNLEPLETFPVNQSKERRLMFYMKKDMMPHLYWNAMLKLLCVFFNLFAFFEPLETFPVNQSKERRLMFHMKKDIMPHLYWNAMLNGHWGGPKIIRKLAHLGFSK